MKITCHNLDKTIEINTEIQKEVQTHIMLMERYFKKFRIYAHEKLALQILKDHNLIQLPIPDPDWGGAIYELPNGNKIPVINTAQPRLYQYFIYWHEIYHLTETSEDNITHDITTEFNLTERKADYFAGQILISDDVYDYYYHLKHSSFIDRLACCMDTFKAPYKAILIQLYEIALHSNNIPLQNEIKKHFDIKLSYRQWEKKFLELSLDNSLVQPTYITDFGRLKDLVHEKSNNHSDVEVFTENKNFLLGLEKKFQAVKDKGNNG